MISNLEGQGERERHGADMTPIEGLCWLASQDGGRVDLTRDRPERHQRKIDAALEAGTIDGEGWLTATGWRIAEARNDEEARPASRENT